MAPTKFTLLLIILLSISLLTPLILAATPTLGITYSHHPTTTPRTTITTSPDNLTATLTHLGITSVRLLDPDPALIRAFSYTSISLLLSIPNSQVPSLATNQSTAAAWLYTHVVPFYPRANITAISVGSDIISSSSDLTDAVLPAIKNLHVALHELGIRKVSVSTTFSLISALTTAFPPSSAEFQEPVNTVLIHPLLDFLAEANSSFLINLYPYNLYREFSEIPLGFALFQEGPFNFRDDPTTGVRYRNLFDMMVDAVLAAMAVAGHENIPVIVAETGWPSSPGAEAGEETDANPEFAEMYLRGLVRHLKSGGGSTPLKKEGVSEVYVFELLDRENVKGSDHVRQWGVMYPNLTAKYKVDFSGSTSSRRRAGDGEGRPGFFVVAIMASVLFMVLGLA